MLPRVFLHYYEGDDPAAHLSILVDVPASHRARPATSLRPLFATLYEAARGQRPPKAGLLRIYNAAGNETARPCGELEPGAHVFLALPPPVARAPAPVPVPALRLCGGDPNVVTYFDSSDEEREPRWEGRRFGDKRIVGGALCRDDGSRDVGRWLDDRRFCAQLPPGRMNNKAEGTWLAVFTDEGAGTTFRRGIHADADLLEWRPTLFEYFVAEGEPPRPPAVIDER